MPFKSNFVQYSPSSTFRKNEFVTMDIGKTILRFLQEESVTHFVHFIASQSVMIKCLGEECPICARNKELYTEAAKKAKANGEKVSVNTISGYFSRSQVAYVNVLDRTKVKICPKPECQAEIKPGNLQGKFPATCPKCNTAILKVEATPLNKVKIFNFGQELSAQIEAAELSKLTEEGEPVGILNMDLDLMVLPSSNGKKTKTITAGQNTDAVEYPEDSLFDLEKAVLELNPEEIQALVRGNKLRDILSARRAVAESTEDTTEESVEKNAEAIEDINNRVGSTFLK